MKRFISLAISTAILVILYSKINFQQLLKVFRDCNLAWLSISLTMVIPITLITAWRLQQLMPKNSNLGLLEANRLILGSSVLNMILPSKMGEIAKAYFLRDRGHLSGSLSISLVIFERIFDLLSLLFYCVLGLIIYPNKDEFFLVMTIGILISLSVGLLLICSQNFALFFLKSLSKISPNSIKLKIQTLESSWQEMHQYFWSHPNQLITITSTSIFLWFLHLLQIWFFILALNAWVPFVTNLALSSLAILAGLLPLTFAGVGTRDAALVYLYQPYFSASIGAALGILCTSRYFLPALVGLPFLNQMMSAVRQFKRS
ncbi:CHP374-containing protein [Crocosphaera subtropica ATCC 51142]|uniref:CHP374-containing protein n=1 Tax=Crocosphaera subtropica (strain ATCC 51142 / BH68) TaxID=43989 RepID=B1WYC0_CROS5|nr:lysylphosphatidylglycerol synthase transmembrane domain-containing protein [Crocosphaera subtropica]ACB52704.1 CHP374-containing protein [Crocosphaera subtropica ATCC 51142]